MASVYLAYKIFFLNAIWKLEDLDSRQRDLYNDLQELGKKLTFNLDNEKPSISTEDVRERWRDPKILKMAVALTKKAAEEMKLLYADLENWDRTFKLTGREKNQKMAETLICHRVFSSRFCNANTVTLLDIYRAIRFLEYRYTKNGKLNNMTSEITEDDGEPFFQEGTPQWECRKVYHEIIDLFAPIMQVLKALPPERQADVERYWKWAVRDDFPMIADDYKEGFKLIPADKPA